MMDGETDEDQKIETDRKTEYWERVRRKRGELRDTKNAEWR